MRALFLITFILPIEHNRSSALCQLCHDGSVATRKAAADALTKLVQANYDSSEEYSAQSSSLEIAWAFTVLPLVSDAEASCVAKAVDFFSDLVIDPLVELGEDFVVDDDDDDGGCSRCLVAWRILSKLSDGSKEAGGSRNASGSLVIALQQILIRAGKDGKSLAKNLLRAVYRVGSMSVGLDTSSFLDDSTMSHDGDRATKKDLFEPNTTAMRTGAWCLLLALCSCLGNDGAAKNAPSSHVSLTQAVKASKIDSSFLTQSLQKLRALLNSPDVPSDKKGSLAATSRDCLRVIANMGSFVPFNEARAALSDLKNDLETFSVSIDLISAVTHAIIALTRRMCEDVNNDLSSLVRDWANGLLKHCEDSIESRFSLVTQQGGMNDEDRNRLSNILYLVGEVTMIGFNCGDGGRDKQEKSEPVRGLVIRPSSNLVHLVNLMLPDSMPMVSTDDVTPTPSSIRAHAFVTLGKVRASISIRIFTTIWLSFSPCTKLCLRDEKLAKESLNILARELHQDSNSDPAVQSNCLMVMGDLCVRYTNLVDKYLPFMAACLQAGEKKSVKVNSSSRLSLTFNSNTDRYSLVKKNAILLLSSLLLQDYVKWRGLFIHRFLAAVADEDDEVSMLAQAALRGPLLDKQPNLIANHFVGAVFVFNSCKAHPIYAAEASGGGNGLSVDFEEESFIGSDGYHRRWEVYQMMLANMTDEQKLEVTARLVKVVLGGALEQSGDLSTVCKMPVGGLKSSTKFSSSRIEAATNVLTDTLSILTSKEIKVGRKGSEDAEDDLIGVHSSKPDQRNLHKARLLTKISRKHLIEIVIPILCNLKTVLEGSHSPLLKNLLQYLGKIFRSYKSEVQEHLANDPTLLQELEYDTRQYEKKQKRMERDSIMQAEVVVD